MSVLLVVVRLLAVLAIFSFVVRCAVEVAKGYASRPGLKVGLLVLSLALIEGWYRLLPNLQPNWIGYVVAWTPIVGLGVLLIWTAFREGRRVDRYNLFALIGTGFLVLAMLFGWVAVWTMEYESDPVFGLADPRAVPFLRAARVGAVAVGLGLLSVLTIALRRFGTRGIWLAAACVVMPPCWGWILWGLLFFECSPMPSNVTPPTTVLERELADLHPRHPGLGFVPRISIDALGAVVALETGEALDPEEELASYLATCVPRAKLDHGDKELGTGPLIPYSPIELIVDRDTPFGVVQQVMEIAFAPRLEFWRFDMLVLREEAPCGCRVTWWPLPFVEDPGGEAADFPSLVTALHEQSGRILSDPAAS